jgi:ectoine hydroxylase-related dioxygenase (phytanoyl-CoA dioxygenase family)
VYFGRGNSGTLIKPPDHITGGFEIFPAILERHEVADIAASLEQTAVERSRAGTRHLMRHPAVQQVARDPRLVAVALRFLGASAIPFRATLFDKAPDHNWLVAWHQDTALPLRERRDASGWGPWSIKAGITYAHAPAPALSRVIALRVHVDDSGQGNGPLRVLPGTHLQGVMTDADVARCARDVDAVTCVSPGGGVVAMRPLLVHASSKAQTDQRRRVLHIEYAESLDMGDGLELAIA